MTPAEELRDAVRLLRDPVNCLPKALTESLADLLAQTARQVETWTPEPELAEKHFCHALAVARAVRRGTA